MDGSFFWSEVLSALSIKRNTPLYKQWIKLTCANYDIENNSVTIYTPNSFIKEYLVKSLDDIKNIVESIMYKNTNINIEIDSTKINEADNSLVQANNTVLKKIPPKKIPGVNSRFTFDNFIVGSNSQFCHAAALSVAARPATAYNPFFIFADSGLGKTHLLQAIANYITEYHVSTRVLYMKSEKFVSSYVDAIRNKTINEFRKNLNDNYDVLIFDDIQFIAGKEQSQNELFYLISTAHENNKQIIMASDKYPKDIENFDPRLQTRSCSGLICDIKAPEFETRVAIIKSEIKNLNIPMSDESVNKLASISDGNVRELKGNITKIGAYASFANTNITPDFVEEVFKEKRNYTNKVLLDVNTIIKKVASFYSVYPNDILSSERKKEILLPRHICIYLSHELTNKSFTDLAKLFKKKNHSTIIHAYNKIKKNIDVNISVKNDVLALIKELDQI